MVAMNGYTVTPNHRQNRRRERPGSRTRRTVTRKANIQAEYAEGFLDAYDSNVTLPSDRARPSPLLRESVHQTWQRWKEREAEEQALREMDRLQALEREQQRLYGGDIDDDELYRMGILYDNYEDDTSHSISDVSCETPSHPLQQESPLFTIRYRKARRSRGPRRRSTWRTLPLYLSLSHLRDDIDIANFISASPLPKSNTKPTIQHRRLAQTPSPISLDIPPSLPLASAVPAFKSSPNTSPNSFSSAVPPLDWEFINAPIIQTTTQPTTPISEPETWILLSDDS